MSPPPFSADQVRTLQAVAATSGAISAALSLVVVVIIVRSALRKRRGQSGARPSPPNLRAGRVRQTRTLVATPQPTGEYRQLTEIPHVRLKESTPRKYKHR